MSVSYASTRIYITSCQMIHRGHVSLQQLVIYIIYLELLWVKIHWRVGMWCLILCLKTKKSSNTLITISLVFLGQMNRKNNMIRCLLQQDRWLMARSMSHQVKEKTGRKATTMTKNMVMEVRIIIICRHQLRQFKIYSTGRNRISQMQNILNMNFLTVDTSRKLNGKYLWIPITSLKITQWIFQMMMNHNFSIK